MTFSALELHTQSDGQRYEFGQFILRPDGSLLRDSDVIPLPPKELAILRLLLSRAGQIVPTSQLRQTAWGKVHVSADSLPRCISSLRARLQPDDCIQAVYKRGYRLNLPVKKAPAHDRDGDRDRPESTPLENEPPDSEHLLGNLAAKICRLPRLAILPFATGESVPEFLGPGVAEESMLRLSRLRHPVAEVLARDSVFTLAVRGNTTLEIAHVLHADLAVTGVITAMPRHYRLRAEMIRVNDAVQLWVDDFLVPRHLLAYADARIAKRIGARIRDTFASVVVSPPVAADAPPQALALFGAGETRRSEAFAIEMRARADWDTFQLPRMQEAMLSFQRALDLDPERHSARMHLMHGYLALSSFGYMRADAAAELARKQAEALLTHSPTGHAAHPTLGWIHFFHDRDLEAATASFARPQGPGYYPWTPVYQARFALGQGRFQQALALLREALEGDPFSSVLHWRLAWALHLAGEAVAAVEQAKHTLNIFPNDPGALFFGSLIFAANSNACTEIGGVLGGWAVSIATRLMQAAPSLDPAYAALAYAQARQGRIAEARALLDRQKWQACERFVLRCFDAPALVELGEHEAALDVLATAEKQHCPWLFELLGDPRLQPLHRDPEFHRLGNLSGHMLVENASVA